jgi:hypothetical protein
MGNHTVLHLTLINSDRLMKDYTVYSTTNIWRSMENINLHFKQNIDEYDELSVL